MHALIMADIGVRRERRKGWRTLLAVIRDLRRGRSEKPCGSVASPASVTSVACTGLEKNIYRGAALTSWVATTIYLTTRPPLLR